MHTRVVRIDPANPDPAILAEAVRILRANGLVAFPTETVYGLGGRALSSEAVTRIFEAKGRPRAHPLIAHITDEEAARSLSAEWSDRASRFARAFWPGPLTLVVPRAAYVPESLVGGGRTVAVRAPSNPIALALLYAIGEPLAAPSANRFQSLSPTRAEHVVRALEGRVELILDGGPCIAGIESTVVDVRGEHATVLRPGAIAISDLRTVEPTIVATAAPSVAGDAMRPSPGMDARHYAPRARLVVAPDRYSAAELAASHHARGEHVALVTRAPVGLRPFETRILPDDPAAFAAQLFATLHALDDAGTAIVFVEAVPTGEAWWAVADRLRRASA